MAAARSSTMRVSSLLSSHDSLRCITRQMRSMEVSSSIAVMARNFSSSKEVEAEEGGEQQRQSTTSTAKTGLFDSILNPSPATATPSSSSYNRTPTSSSPRTSSSSNYSSQPTQAGAPYRLHAHCTKHNIILNLTRALPADLNELRRTGDAHALLGHLKRDEGTSDTAVDKKILGQTVLRTSPGLLGMKKAQRGTFEAASRASVQMFNLISQLGTKDRKTKHGRTIRDLAPASIELVFRGFGQGRDALVAAISSAQGEQVRRLIKRVTDATPIKIGGTRPKKRRKLSPPLDLGRRRR